MVYFKNKKVLLLLLFVVGLSVRNRSIALELKQSMKNWETQEKEKRGSERTIEFFLSSRNKSGPNERKESGESC